MDKYMHVLAHIFVWHPFRCWAISVLFFLLYIFSRKLEAMNIQVSPIRILFPAIAWLLFGLLEYSSTIERANIRLDLLVTWPLLIIITSVFLFTWLISFVFKFRFF